MADDAQGDRARELPTAVRRAIIAALIALGALLVAYVAAVVVAGDGVRSGTTVAGVEIGGLPPDEAAAVLEEELGSRIARTITVRSGKQQLEVDPTASGIALDAPATVAAASGRVLNPLALADALTGSREIEPVIVVDEGALSATVDDLAASIDAPPVEPRLRMQGLRPIVREGRDGRVLDREAMADALIAAAPERRRPVPAPTLPASPTIGPDAIAAGEALARAAVSGPVQVRASGITATLTPRAIADALSFTAESGAFVPVLDGAVLHAAIAEELAPIEQPGNDATFRIKDGVPVVVPSRVGTGIADDELATKVATVLEAPAGQRSVEVSVGTREPALTTEQAQALGVKERISTFTQKFPYAAYRVQNIGQAARYLNGTLLLPGETFSFNDTVRERTVENGYTKGFIISTGGIFAEELGGGVSAAATATWTGAFFAGMERVSTTAHSIYISRYQPGLEATVSWGNFDMTFRNPTPYGVFITASTTDTSMTVSYWSTRIYDEIAAEFGPRTGVRPYSTIYDSSAKCLGQSGVNGFSIDVDRVFYQGGQEVKRETISTAYRPTPQVICDEKPKKKKPGKGKGRGDAEAPGTQPSPEASAGTPAPSGKPQEGGGSDDAAPAPGA